MIDTYRARSAIREVGKALGLPETEVGLVATSFPHISAGHIREGIERLPELRGLNLPMPQLELLFRVAERIGGFPRHIALHPCGIVLASHDLVERVPLERSANGHRMAQADKDDVELLGYLKLDILGVRMLSSMRHAIDEIARTTGEKVDLERIPLDDEPTFELIRASDTLGCFQIESPGQRELLQKLQPTRFDDLIIDISLFRPGPVKSDMIRPFLACRAGLRRPEYVHPDLRPALQETHGVIVYHEQVMRTLSTLAGYDLTHADHVRRHLDDESMVPGFRAEFLERAVARGVDRDGRRAHLARRRGVRELRVLQGARGGVRGAHLPVVVAEDPLPGALPGGDPDPRPGDVPAPAPARRRPAARRADPAARREPLRARVRGGGDRRRRVRDPARAAGRPRHVRCRDPLDPGRARRPAVHRRGGPAAADHGGPAGGRGARPRGGVRRPADGPRTAVATCTRRSPPRRPARATSSPWPTPGRPPTRSPTTPTPRSSAPSSRSWAWTPPGTS